MTTLLIEIKDMIDETKLEKNHLTKEQLRVFEKRYDALIAEGLEDTPFVVTEVLKGKAKNGVEQNKLQPTTFWYV